VNIFLSFASEQNDDAELIAVSLRDRGHTVFFSKDTLPAAQSFDLRIEKAVAAADLVIFLLSPQSVARGKYTLTELAFVKQKWKNPSGHVLPVMVVKTQIETIPSYLRAVGILEPEGSVAAETASQADKLLVKGGRRRLALFAVAGLVSGVLSYFAWFSPYLTVTILQPKDGSPASILPGIIFGILVAGCNWMFGVREKVLLAALIAFTTIAWVLAYDSTAIIAGQLTGYKKEVANSATPAEPVSTDAAAGLNSDNAMPAERRKEMEYLPFSGALSGLVGGLVGGMMTVAGISVANRRFRRVQDLLPVIVTATVLGALVELTTRPNASTLTLLLLFGAWQTAMIVLIANVLAANPAESA
jgi:hypothetical protein